MSLLEQEKQTYEKNLPNYNNNRATQTTLRQDLEQSLDIFSTNEAHGRDFNVKPVTTDGGSNAAGYSDYFDDMSEKNWTAAPYVLPAHPYVDSYFYTDLEDIVQEKNDNGYKLYDVKYGV